MTKTNNLATQPAQRAPAMAGDEWADREIIALSREMLAGKRTENMVAFARRILASKRVPPAPVMAGDEHSQFEAWRKREYPWTSPATDGMAFAWDAWQESALLSNKRVPPATREDAIRTKAIHAAGTALSNAAYNLAQRSGETLTSNYCQSLDDARKAWDAAIAMQTGATMTQPLSDQLQSRGVPASLYSAVKDLERQLDDARQDNVSLLHLLALIREAVGDEGKHMQDELVTFISDQRQGHLAHIALLKATLKAERAEADAMREALKPFAKEFAEWDGVGVHDAMSIDEMYGHDPDEFGKITFGDLRRAAALLEES